MQINAIETRYEGYRFRSRLEARWAVFFDAMKVKWEYEKEGFELPSGLYLPDFWISVPKWWVEIKPYALTDKEKTLCEELAVTTRHLVFALAGNIGTDSFEAYLWNPRYITGRAIFSKGKRTEAHLSSYYFNLFLYRLCSDAIPKLKSGFCAGRYELDAAFNAARSARFEHGEKP